MLLVDFVWSRRACRPAFLLFARFLLLALADCLVLSVAAGLVFLGGGAARPGFLLLTTGPGGGIGMLVYLPQLPQV